MWFDEQFLGDGKAYNRRANEFSNTGRRALRTRVVAALKKASDQSFKSAERDLKKLESSGDISSIKRHWISMALAVPLPKMDSNPSPKYAVSAKFLPEVASQYQLPMKKKLSLLSTQITLKKSPPKISLGTSLNLTLVWEELGITGEGTLNIVDDDNFIITPSLARTIYTNPNEIPDNGKDDDENGLIDDYHGFNFDARSSNITTKQLTGDDKTARRILHGSNCAHIICGAEAKNGSPQFGIAPLSKWAGIVTSNDIEAAVEWAIEPDTYSMSFSLPDVGEERSHWRKVMEHGSFCGIFFVSGAGNNAKSEKVPVQIRTPEDIPEAVFAAAGVHQDLSKTSFSSVGPAYWDTEHYKDGTVQKPEVCAFNHKLPL